jgi:cell division protein FtsW
MSDKSLRVLLWVITGVITLFGLVMVVSTTSTSHTTTAMQYGFIVRQFAAVIIGLIGAFFLSYFGTARMRQTWFIALVMLLTIGLLLAVQVIGLEINGARRWLNLGPVNIQPAELAKLSLIIVLAWQLNHVAEKVRLHWHGVLIPMLVFGIAAVLVYLTRDLGSVRVMAVVVWTMLFFAKARWIYVTLVGIGMLPLIAYYAVFDTYYRFMRINAFMNPWDSTNAATYHLQQSLISVGSGGVHGVGLGQSSTFLPEDHTDFIFARVAQETGMIGAMTLVVFYLLFVLVGLAIANHTRDRHQRLLAVGATIVIGVQAFWNIMVAIGAVPTKGLTLPFVSYGGTSMVMCLLTVGLLDAVISKPVRMGDHLETQAVRLGALTTKRQRRYKTRTA